MEGIVDSIGRFRAGIEVHLSDNHTLSGKPFEDICDELAGKYPKDFKFTGWHPLCRCYTTTILKTREEMDEDDRRIMAGEEPIPSEESGNYVSDVPEGFGKWIDGNRERIERAKSLPYFMRDNEKYIKPLTITPQARAGADEAQKFNEEMMRAADVPKVPKARTREEILAAAQERHAARTPGQIEKIQADWNRHRLQQFENAVDKELLLEQVRETLQWMRDSNYIGDFDDFKRRASLLDKAVKRHAARTQEEIDAIYGRLAKRNNRVALKNETIDEMKKRLGSKMPKTFDNLEKTIRKYEKTKLYGDIAKAHKAEIEKLMRKVFNVHDLGMNVEEGVLELILNSKFKNTFETGTSGDYLGGIETSGKISVSHNRLKAAHKLFGLSKDLDKGQLS